MKPPVKALIMRNEMLAVFDADGQQVPEFQGLAFVELPRLLAAHPGVVIEDLR